MSGSFIVIGIVSAAVLLFLGQLYWIEPRCTTCFFHFNIDYRLGNEEAGDIIITEPYYKLLKMYEKHENWKFTVECQAAMIEKIYSDKDYEDIADLTTELVEREQMELICALQYSELFYMYPEDVLSLNFEYANKTLEKYDLLDKRSNCLLFQEGQFGYGLVSLLNSPYAENVDTVLVSTQQIVDFQQHGYLSQNYPVYELYDEETDNSIKILQYNYMPQWEAGYMHSWNYLLDAELGFEDKDSEKEFVVDDNKLEAYEQQLLMLELEGNEFMTCSEWVEHCENVDAIGELDYYIPECNWGTTMYNSSYIWAANNGDSTDDGELLANNYRCRQIILATRVIYNQYKNHPNVTPSDRTAIDDKFEMAEKLWLQATCTDATGIGPDPVERLTAEGNVLIAERNCSQILEILANRVSALNVSKIQVDLKTGSVYNNTANFLSLINVSRSDLDLDDLPFDVEISSSVVDGELEPNTVVSLISYNSSDSDNYSYHLYRLDVTFNGTHDWNDDSILKISMKFIMLDEGDFGEILYSPSLMEGTTKRIYRYDYIYDPVYIFLPLSNGLLFIPDEYTGFRGNAIIKNVTCRHTSWLWEYYDVEVLETDGLHMDAHHQFYIMENVSLEQALDFANRINVSPPWVVSKNATLIQGNEFYSMYAQMENKEAGGEGEWWD